MQLRIKSNNNNNKNNKQCVHYKSEFPCLLLEIALQHSNLKLWPHKIITEHSCSSCMELVQSAAGPCAGKVLQELGSEKVSGLTTKNKNKN